VWAVKRGLPFDERAFVGFGAHRDAIEALVRD